MRRPALLAIVMVLLLVPFGCCARQAHIRVYDPVEAGLLGDWLKLDSSTFMEGVKWRFANKPPARGHVLSLAPDHTCVAGDRLTSFLARCLDTLPPSQATNSVCGWGLVPGQTGHELVVMIHLASPDRFTGARLGVFAEESRPRDHSLAGACKATGDAFSLVRPES